MAEEFKWPEKMSKGCRKGSDKFLNTRVLPTGIPVIDHVLGGGWGMSRFVELYGNFASGKSALGYHTLAKVQKVGGRAFLIDTEGGFNREFFSDLGGDPELLEQPDDNDTDTVEGIFSWVESLLKELVPLGKDHPAVAILWDSIAMTRTTHLAKEGMDKVDLSKPRMISQGIDLIAPLLKRTNTIVCGVNQTIESLNTNDSAKLTPGGRKWKYASSQRLELQYDGGSKTSLIVDEPTGDVIGRKIKGRVEKSRLGASQREFTLHFFTEAGRVHPIFGTTTRLGFDTQLALFDYYCDGSFYITDKKDRVVAQAGKGWYCVHPSIDPESKKFRRGDWLEVLEKFPQLHTLLYDDLEINPDELNVLE